MDEKKNRLLLLDRVFFATCSASLITLVVLEAINPLSPIGQFLFWPQNTLKFIHLHPHSPFGARVTFLGLDVILSISILLLLTAKRPWTQALLYMAPGLLAVLAPMVGWLAAMRSAGLFELAMGIATAIFATFTLYLLRKRWSGNPLQISLILMGIFGAWAYAYRSHLDPVMLTVPLFACLSYVAWFLYVSSLGANRSELNPATAL